MRAVQSTARHIVKPRGDQEVKKYAAEYRIGNTLILIDDSYAARTPEEQEKVDRDIAEAAWVIVESLIKKGEAV